MSILSDIRVVDLTRLISGPFATRLLADFGADVIRIQSQKTAKGMEDPESPFYQCLNRNKRGVTLNLDAAEGRELLLRIAEKSDLLVENFSPRVMENFGLTYEVLRSRNERLVVVSISSFGRDGPWRDYVGFSHTFHALSGLTHLVSLRLEEPLQIGFAYADMVIGLFAALACLAALSARKRTGVGLLVDLSGYEAMVSLLGDFIVSPGSEEGRFPARYCVACRDGRFCALSLGDEGDLYSLLSEMEDGSAGLKDIDHGLIAFAGTVSAEEMEERLRRRGIEARRVRHAKEILEDGELKESGFLAEREGRPMLLPLRGLGAVAQGKAPRLGEHNIDVFIELLGMTEEEYDRCVREGVIF